MKRGSWKPGRGTAPSMDEARAYASWVEESPGTRYKKLGEVERAALTGITPSTAENEQLGLFPDESLPSKPVELQRHRDLPGPRRARNEKAVADFAGIPVSRMRRTARYETDAALAEGKDPNFYAKTARNQVGRMAQRTGVDFQTAAAAVATTSPQRPWMMGSEERNVNVAERAIEETIRTSGLGRQEKHVAHDAWDALRDQDRDYRYAQLKSDSALDSTPDVEAKTRAVVEFGAAGADPMDARWGGRYDPSRGLFGDKDLPVFGTGLKETSFYQGLAQPGVRTNRVTLDKHMSDGLAGTELGDAFRKPSGRYRVGADAFERASLEAGLSPEAGQAVAWTRIKENKGHVGGSYDESGEGKTYAEREEERRQNPPMIRPRNNEWVPNF